MLEFLYNSFPDLLLLILSNLVMCATLIYLTFISFFVDSADNVELDKFTDGQEVSINFLIFTFY